MPKQVFPIIDPLTGRVVDEKSRTEAHLKGLWHRGVQANIVREGKNGTPDILIQERSDIVDISLSRMDQSLATQMLVQDRGNRIAALYRGLKEELAIEKSDVIDKIEVGNGSSFKLVKTYKENDDLFNREFTSLFLLKVKDDCIRTNSVRVRRVLWLPLDDFADLIRVNPNRFTKTVRFYFVNPDVYAFMKTKIRELLTGEKSKTKLNFTSEFYSYREWDILVNRYRGGLSDVSIYSTQNSVRLVESHKRIKNLIIDAGKSNVFIRSDSVTFSYNNFR